MSQLSVDDPDKVEKTTVTKDGRITVGREFAGQDVEIVVSLLSDTDENGGA